MAKKSKAQEPAVSLAGVTNRDILQRLNFLYQASTYLAISSTSGSTSSNDARLTSMAPTASVLYKRTDKHYKRRKDRHPSTVLDLSRNYVQSMKVIAQKATVRMDPNVKRTICKKCNTIMIPGTTGKVRIKSSESHGHIMSCRCTACGFSLQIPAPPVLNPDNLPESKPDSASLPQPQVQPVPSSTGGDPQGGDAMQVDVADPAQAVSAPVGAIPRQRKARKQLTPRPLPLFQRKGHVVFRGNERLEEDDAGS